jgi:parallel beta-helix repeat protein
MKKSISSVYLFTFLGAVTILISNCSKENAEPLETPLSIDTKYYCDPVTGHIGNDGSKTAPWSTLAEVIASGKKVEAGDTIVLLSGYHGTPQIKTKNTDFVVIIAGNGASPLLGRMQFNNASHWILSGVEVNPALGNVPGNAPIVSIVGSDHIVVQNCNIASTNEMTTTWTRDDLRNNTKINDGISSRNSKDCVFENNRIRNVKNGVSMFSNADNNKLSGCLIEYITGDGVRMLSDGGIMEYCTIQNFFKVYENDEWHYDFVQSWSVGADGKVGTGVVKDLQIRGNYFLTHKEDNQSYKTAAVQGVGFFDGMFENLLIENNIIVSNHWHGISVYGAINSNIVNNTVVKRDNSDNMRPWIGVFDHKNGTPPTGNFIRNNICPNLSGSSSGRVAENNILVPVEQYTTYFRNPAAFDFHLKASSPAIDKGSATMAPSIDFDRQKRTAPYDVGADEL